MEKDSLWQPVRLFFFGFFFFFFFELYGANSQCVYQRKSDTRRRQLWGVKDPVALFLSPKTVVPGLPQPPEGTGEGAEAVQHRGPGPTSQF